MKRSIATIQVMFKSDDQAKAFVEALTGNDDDVLLCAEKAVNARLGYHNTNGIWLSAVMELEEVDPIDYVSDEHVGAVREAPLFTNAFAIDHVR